jgi:hypothetical protein
MLNNTEKQLFGFYPISDVILSCHFNTFICDLSDFEWYYDSYYGNCYTFNRILGKQNKPVKTISKNGNRNGLIMEVYIGQPEQAPSMITQSGVHLTIHNNSVVPSLHEGIDISPGFHSNIDISRIYNRKLGYPFNECIMQDSNYDSYLFRNTVRNNRIYRRM